jgi:hypothetical protein
MVIGDAALLSPSVHFLSLRVEIRTYSSSTMNYATDNEGTPLSGASPIAP